MTAPLCSVLSVGDKVTVSVDLEQRELYFPEFLHRMTGKVWQMDDEHIWVSGYVKDMDGFPYLSGPHRYPWTDITVSFNS